MLMLLTVIQTEEKNPIEDVFFLKGLLSERYWLESPSVSQLKYIQYNAKWGMYDVSERKLSHKIAHTTIEEAYWHNVCSLGALMGGHLFAAWFI